MSTQIAVRLPDDLVEFLDAIVASGASPSRAAVVTTALERDFRRRLAERDAVVFSRDGGYPDLAAMTDHVSSRLSEIE